MANVSKAELQLVGITALLVAAKYEEIYPPSPSELAFIAADTYTNQQIRQTEIDILRALDFQLGRPNPLTFLRRYSSLLGTTTLVHNLAKYFIEASYLTLDCRSLLPSQCAVGALSLAAKVMTRGNMASIWSQTMENYTWYSHQRATVFTEQVLKNVLSYYSLCNRASSSDYKFVRQKYTEHYHAVAAHPRLQEKLEALAKAPLNQPRWRP